MSGLPTSAAYRDVRRLARRRELSVGQLQQDLSQNGVIRMFKWATGKTHSQFPPHALELSSQVQKELEARRHAEVSDIETVVSAAQLGLGSVEGLPSHLLRCARTGAMIQALSLWLAFAAQAPDVMRT